MEKFGNWLNQKFAQAIFWIYRKYGNSLRYAILWRLFGVFHISILIAVWLVVLAVGFALAFFGVYLFFKYGLIFAHFLQNLRF